MEATPSNHLDRMNSLLRGEIAAAETYEQLLEDLPEDAPEGNVLRGIQLEHGAAIRWLYEEVSRHGGDPSTSSGTWGTVANTAEGAARAVGMRSALQMLREGERRGLKEYEDAAATHAVPPDCREHVVSVLIPQQRRHLEALGHLLEQ